MAPRRPRPRRRPRHGGNINCCGYDARAATLQGIEAQGWSFNRGRYLGVTAGEAASDEDFKEQRETLNEEPEPLNAAARELETTIASNVTEILET